MERRRDALRFPALRTYSFSPTQRGSSNESVAITSDGGDGSVSLSGQGVAPENQVSAVDAGDVRIGTSASVNGVVQNNGDGGLVGVNLQGTAETIATATEFSGGGQTIDLPDALCQLIPVSYTPVDHGTDSESLAIDFTNGSSDGTNSAQQVQMSLLGTGVGPIFGSSVAVGGDIDFGVVSGTEQFILAIDDLETDVGLAYGLQELTLVDAIFGGADADRFSLVGFTPGSIVIDPGSQAFLTIEYDPSGAGLIDLATLTLLTDVGAILGGDGADYGFNLSGEGAVPAPGVALLLGSGLLGLLVTRRRRLVPAA